MKVCVIGTGYVGLVTGACLAEMGNDVVCVDKNPEVIESLRRGHVPIFEPGLEEIIEANTREERLRFTTDLAEGVVESQICFIAVGTPPSEDGSADLTAVFDVAREIASAMDGYRVIATKSTVPVGTAARLEAVIKESTTEPFSIVSNPEFLKQGSAVNDFLKPDRVIVGASDPKAFEIMQELYGPFLRTGNPIITMDVVSAELTKYVANAFLATKISFINEVSYLCEKVGADIDQIRAGICTDPRIGRHFLFPGVGFGGSCLPKDIRALLKTAEENGCECPVLAGAEEVNHRQKERFLEKIFEHFGTDLRGRVFGVWGLSFKPRTDDMREAPSLMVVSRLREAGASIRAFDPQAMIRAASIFGDDIRCCESSYEACEGADALVVLTEWNEFRRPDYERVRRLMRNPVIFDGRNLYDIDRMEERGFLYYCVGRPQPQRAPVES